MTLLRGYADDKPLGAWLQEDIWPAEAELGAEDVRAGTELALVEMLKSGTTAFADMYFHVPEVAAAVETAGVRARLGHGAVTVGKDEGDAVADNEESVEVAREFDGAADGRIRTAYMPHSLTTVGEEYLREFVGQAREAGVPVHFHANETTDEVDPIVDERGVCAPRVRRRRRPARARGLPRARGPHRRRRNRVARRARGERRPLPGVEHETRVRDGARPGDAGRRCDRRARHGRRGVEQRPRPLRRVAGRRDARQTRDR